MKTKFLFIIILLSSFSFGQQTENPIFDKQDWFKRSMNVIYQNLNTNELTYKCYFKNNEFYVTCEYRTDLFYSEYSTIQNELNELSKDRIYRMAEELVRFNGGLIKDFEENYGTNYINFEFTNLTKDYKTIDYNYYVKVSDLYEIASYYNKKDLYKILK